MKFRIKPEIKEFETIDQMLDHLNIQETDIIVTNRYIFAPFFEAYNLQCKKMFLEDFGTGEPTDTLMMQAKAAMPKDVTQIIAIGGGSVIDVAKILSLTFNGTIEELFYQKISYKRTFDLTIIPTTCGTGSEVTNVSVTAITSQETKKGLADDQLFADQALLVPALLENLPYRFFATSSIDALVHAIEAFLSNFATEFSSIFAKEAIKLILTSYAKIQHDESYNWKTDSSLFLRASCMAGVAFGNSGTATVHALSYPLSGKYHIPHGEANQLMLYSVLKYYDRINPDGKLDALKKMISEFLNVPKLSAIDELERCLNAVNEKKSLLDYGIESSAFASMAEQVFEEQQRLLKHSYIPMTTESLIKCYSDCK